MLKSLLLSIFLGLMTRELTDKEVAEEEYDFVIVGAGTSGSVIASRLSENLNLKILVLEAGGSETDEPKIQVPIAWPELRQSAVDWNYRIVPQRYTEATVPDQTELWPRGKVIGGSSSINGMVYIRGSPHDYDSWEDYGATGWGWKDVEPYFRKVEGALDDEMSKNLGRDGPLKIKTNDFNSFSELIVKTAEDLGIKKIDYHDDIEGISQVTYSIFQGLRQNAAKAYLYPFFPEREERFHVILNAYVTKINMDTNAVRPKATGVRYFKDGKSRDVRARKEVIISAGAIETPHILMLSGIGPEDHLAMHKVKKVAHVPGVGSNLQDHPMFFSFYHARQMPEGSVLNSQMMENGVDEYIINGTGPWAIPLGSNFKIHLQIHSDKKRQSSSKRPFTDIQMTAFTLPNNSDILVPSQDPDSLNPSFFAVVSVSHPKSMGKVRLKSSDPFLHPLVDPNYLSNDDDVKVLIEGMRRWEAFEKSKLFKVMGTRMIIPVHCKKRCQNQSAPRSDACYRCLIAAGITTQYHPCCTAKIGRSNDEDAVVDERLRVYGVDNLRIADASVMPHITSANLQSPCYMIGEKAADMIKEDWKIDFQ